MSVSKMVRKKSEAILKEERKTKESEKELERFEVFSQYIWGE